MAADTGTFLTILRNINDNLPGLWRFITAGSYLTGIWFAFRAIYHFKEYGELRMMMAAQTDLRKPLMSLMIAVILLWWPEMIHTMIHTAFGSTTISPYIPSGGTPEKQEIIRLAGNIIQFIGFIAFIRGWILISHIGQQGAQPGMFGKAMAHIFAGLFAVNIFATWQVLESIIKAPGTTG